VIRSRRIKHRDASNRFLFDPRFLKRFTEYANGIKLGDGLDKTTTMGPMANARRIEAMESFVNDAKALVRECTADDVLDRQEADGSWAGIQPPWVYSIFALHTLGMPLDHPVITRALDGFSNFMLRRDGRMRMQSCVSPVWDTALAAIAISETGTADDDDAVARARDWLLAREVTREGDWRRIPRRGDAGGWPSPPPRCAAAGTVTRHRATIRPAAVQRRRAAARPACSAASIRARLRRHHDGRVVPACRVQQLRVRRVVRSADVVQVRFLQKADIRLGVPRRAGPPFAQT
jgi:hypothetical protein